MSGDGFLVMAEVSHAALDATVLQPVSCHEDETTARIIAQQVADIDRVTAYVMPVARFTPSTDMMPGWNR